MPKRKTCRQVQWQKKRAQEGKCWKCGNDAHPKLTPNGKVRGFYNLCLAHLEADRQRKGSSKTYKIARNTIAQAA